VGEADYFLGDASKKEARQAAMAAAADNDEIGLPVLGYRNNFLCGVAKRRLGRDSRGPLRLRFSASTIQHTVGGSESHLRLAYRNMLRPRIFLEAALCSGERCGTTVNRISSALYLLANSAAKSRALREGG
jgi:hypothetical protein